MGICEYYTMSISNPRRRRNQPREMAMVTEWVVKNDYLKYATFSLRLGTIHPELVPDNMSNEDLGILSVYRRWADCVLTFPEKTVIVEAKILSKFGAIEALLAYRQLYLSSPEFADRHNLPLELLFLYAIEDPVLTQIAISSGVRVEKYEPSWLADYLEILRGRETRAPRTVF